MRREKSTAIREIANEIIEIGQDEKIPTHIAIEMMINRAKAITSPNPIKSYAEITKDYPFSL